MWTSSISSEHYLGLWSIFWLIMRSLPVGGIQNTSKEKQPICRNFCYCYSLKSGGLILGTLHTIFAILIFIGSSYVVIHSFQKTYYYYGFMEVNNELIPRMYGEFQQAFDYFLIKCFKILNSSVYCNFYKHCFIFHYWHYFWICGDYWSDSGMTFRE